MTLDGDSHREMANMQETPEKTYVAAQVGCEVCSQFSGRGYRFERPSGPSNTTGRVVVCECVVPLCTCGALAPQKPVVGPPYDGLIKRADEAIDERHCACWSVRRRVAALNRMLSEADIPELYRGKLIEDYRIATHDGREIPEADQARAQTVTWLEKFVGGQEMRGLYLYGMPGDGKTLLATGLLTQLILLTARPGLFVNLSRGYFQRLRDTYDNDIPGAETAEQAFARLSRVPFLVLDDLGLERGTLWQVEWLYNLIDERYQTKRVIIVTSNHSLEDLREFSRGRIQSRLRHMCRPVKFPDLDLRELFKYGV